MNLTDINRRYFIAVTLVLLAFIIAMIVSDALFGSALVAIITGTLVGAIAALALRGYAQATI